MGSAPSERPATAISPPRSHGDPANDASGAHEASAARLRIVVEDDGLGTGAQARSRAIERGVRLDETVPGSRPDLVIVREIAGLYEGSLHLDAAPGPRWAFAKNPFG